VMISARRNQSGVKGPASPEPPGPGDDPGRGPGRPAWTTTASAPPPSPAGPPAGLPTQTMSLSEVCSDGLMARAETSGPSAVRGRPASRPPADSTLNRTG